MEADAQACAFLELAATLDERDVAERMRARRNRHAVAHFHIARHMRLDFILDASRLARHAIVGLQSDDRVCRNDELLEGFLRRLRRSRRILNRVLLHLDRPLR